MIKCVDCKFYSSGVKSAKCNAPQILVGIDYETGDKVRSSRDPERPQDIRSNPTLCGSTAKWFKPAGLLKKLMRLI